MTDDHHFLGCLDRPTSGSYHFAGMDVAELGNDELAWLRREAVRIRLSRLSPDPSGSALENVEMPAIYAGIPAQERHARAAALLERLGFGKPHRQPPASTVGRSAAAWCRCPLP